MQGPLDLEQPLVAIPSRVPPAEGQEPKSHYWFVSVKPTSLDALAAPDTEAANDARIEAAATAADAPAKVEVSAGCTTPGHIMSCSCSGPGPAPDSGCTLTFTT